MKKKLVLATITIIALLTTLVMADTEPGDNPGDVVTNPWNATTTETPTTEEITTVEETTVEQTTTERVNAVIDGREVSVKRGGQMALTYETGYGFLMDGKYYKRGEVVTLNDDVEIKTVDEIDVDMSLDGASICLDGRNGIKFKCNLSVKDKLGNDITAEFLASDGVEAGMLLAADKGYTASDLNVTKIKRINGANVVSTGFRDDNSFYCGILNIKSSNIRRKYIGRGYIKLTYGNGLSQYVYANETSRVRSISEVAYSIASNGYKGLNNYEKGLVDGYINAD